MLDSNGIYKRTNVVEITPENGHGYLQIESKESNCTAEFEYFLNIVKLGGDYATLIPSAENPVNSDVHKVYEVQVYGATPGDSDYDWSKWCCSGASTDYTSIPVTDIVSSTVWDCDYYSLYANVKMECTLVSGKTVTLQLDNGKLDTSFEIIAYPLIDKVYYDTENNREYLFSDNNVVYMRNLTGYAQEKQGTWTKYMSGQYGIDRINISLPVENIDFDCYFKLDDYTFVDI